MTWFLDLRTSTKLLTAFGVLLLLLLAVAALGYRTISAIRDSQRALVERDHVLVENLLDLRVVQNAQRWRILEMSLLSDQAAQRALAEEIEAGSRQTDEELRKLTELLREDALFAQPLEELKTHVVANRQKRSEQISKLLTGRIDEARAAALTEGQEIFQRIRQLAGTMATSAKKRIEENVAGSNQRAASATRLFIMLAATALLAAAAMTAAMNRAIAEPLREMTTRAERIATGDVSVSVPARARADEVGELTLSFSRMTQSLRSMAEVAGRIADGDLRVKVAPQSDKDVLGKAFAAMVANLQRLIAQTAEGINVLSTSANEISTSTAQFASTASETAVAVAQTTTTVEEVRQTAHVASQKSKLVSQSAQQVAQTTQAGKKATEETVEAMAHIRTQVESIGDSMMRLSEQSQAIGQIIATVEDLAAQSSILAVNASIEAARAGDHGRGFTVVAQEVRSLAEQSKQATNQVRSILDDIRRATSAAVMATEQGSKAVEAGMKQSREAGQAIHSLATSVDEAARAATQIAASSQEQLVGMDQVATAIESIKQASAQNAESARQLESAALDLKQLGQALKQAIEAYKV
ncbi:MAG TPA: methyl-accepting chemotaxis protein [Candidatus Limnocylindrales bacterium]|nr:methyl-accepting chemotaxis protein [Candidatus Limnocylindrales bacterium]